MNVLIPLSSSKWNEAAAAHLLNRASVGGTPTEIAAVHKKGLTAAARDLVDFSSDTFTPAPPEWAHPQNLRAMRMESRVSAKDPDQDRSKKRDLQMMAGEEIL